MESASRLEDQDWEVARGRTNKKRNDNGRWVYDDSTGEAYRAGKQGDSATYFPQGWKEGGADHNIPSGWRDNSPAGAVAGNTSSPAAGRGGVQ